MLSQSQWNDLTAQQLVRYEALFVLLNEIQMLDDISLISRRVATQWKYFCSVSSWRMVVVKETGFLIIDGHRGEARIAEVETLSPWDEFHWQQQRPRLVHMAEPLEGSPPPEHLAGKSIADIEVLPFIRSGVRIGLLSAAARKEPFGELDNKFLHLFGSHFACRVLDILQRRQAIEVLTDRATRDALTSLLNRGAIIDQAARQQALAKRMGQPFGVIIADIDFFKSINDQHGHLAGDLVLRQVARLLSKSGRDSDSLGRYGGEEFLFVIYPCTAKEVAKAAERFRLAVADKPIMVDDGVVQGGIDVTISLGTSCSDGQDDITLEKLLKQADDALYQSKAKGRNRVTAYPF